MGLKNAIPRKSPPPPRQEHARLYCVLHLGRHFSTAGAPEVNWVACCTT